MSSLGGLWVTLSYEAKDRFIPPALYGIISDRSFPEAHPARSMISVTTAPMSGDWYEDPLVTFGSSHDTFAVVFVLPVTSLTVVVNVEESSVSSP